MKQTIPQDVADIIQRLNHNGFEAFAVGGCVRDFVMGLPPHDWDLCTSALPEQTISCFCDHTIHPIGIQHGTILLMHNQEGYEITTYRTDGSYTDHRHPDGVTFVRSLREDLMRRDFTMNAMAYHPEKGLVDLFGGQADLNAHVIRCVGDPTQRFQEDALRILRALRFASRYGFSIDPATGQAMKEQAHLLQFVAGERILTELKGFFLGQNAGTLLQQYREVFAVLFPELVPMFDHPQYNPHHCYDIWEHTCHAVAGVPNSDLLGFTMLFHDSGKPARFTRDQDGVGHFKGHPIVSAQLAEQALNRLHCDTKSRDTIVTLIEWHDRIRQFTPKTVRRMLSTLGKERTQLLFRVMNADIHAQSPALMPDKLASLAEGQRILSDLLEQEGCITLQTLAVKGRDLMAIGYPAGISLGETLNALLQAVLDGDCPNDRDALLAYAVKL